MNQHRFWKGLLLEMKHGFITLSLSQNRSPCNGIKRAHYPQRNSRSHNKKIFRRLEKLGKLGLEKLIHRSNKYIQLKCDYIDKEK